MSDEEQVIVRGKKKQSTLKKGLVRDTRSEPMSKSEAEVEVKKLQAEGFETTVEPAIGPVERMK